MIKLCENCKREIKLFPSKVKAYTNRKANKHFFCSRKCYQDWWIKNMIEIKENHPHWRGGEIKKECKFCGKFFVKRRRGKDRKYLFCSKECAYSFMKGENSSGWQGGISFESYSMDWTDTLKESIRKRDNYICQLCEIHQDELDGRFKKLAVHHIDYNKKNLNPENLISLCIYCHMKTNFNRNYWMNFFKEISIINPVETLSKKETN